MAYAPRRPGRHERLALRGLEHHLIRWGPDGPDPVVLLHGYADCAATFQFVADELPDAMPLVALDWRGFGESAWNRGPYWFPDYFADLECLLDALSPARPARLVGHSMGANVAMAYAGVRPDRVRALVNLEGFGLPRTTPDQAPQRLAQWLDELQAAAPFGGYADAGELAKRLMKRNPRLTADRAEWVAAAWTAPAPSGGVRLCADPAHRLVNPYLYRRDEMEACWRRVEAPVLLVVGAETELKARFGTEGGPELFRELVPKLTIETVAGAGHMLHHEKPRAVARLIEGFLGSA